jgi:PhzF family phenazine biosynthesis protein
MKQLPYYLLDVFTKEPFGGNPLAVFPHADDVPVELMQRIANELNLSETTFIQKARAEGSDCTVRIFTRKARYRWPVTLPSALHIRFSSIAFSVLSMTLI